jgi:hypothetical protein
MGSKDSIKWMTHTRNFSSHDVIIPQCTNVWEALKLYYSNGMTSAQCVSSDHLNIIHQFID